MKSTSLSGIEVEAEGVIYRNPRPHVRAIHAWHPRLFAGRKQGQIFVTYDLAQAVESLDYRTYISQSDDEGKTWSAPQRLYNDDLLPPTQRTTTHLARPTRMRNGELVAIIGRYFRDDRDQGIINPVNAGLVDIELFVTRSNDDGRSWRAPQPIAPPIDGPNFEVAHPIIELNDGRWMAPLATWHAWNAAPPYGNRAVAFVSTDQGQTWPTFATIMDGRPEDIIFFEQGLTQLADGRVLAVSWAYHAPSSTTRSIDWAISGREGGGDGAFSAPRRTPLIGETAKLIALPDGGALCVYRGIDPPGLCGSILRVHGDELRATEPRVLWRGERTHMASGAPAGEELANLKLGSPHMLAMDGDRVLIAFWCCQNCLFHIRWVRVRIGT